MASTKEQEAEVNSTYALGMQGSTDALEEVRSNHSASRASASNTGSSSARNNGADATLGEAHTWQGRPSLGFAFKHQLWIQLVIGILAFGVPTLLVNQLVHPRDRYFLSGDPTLSYPTPEADTVPFWFIVPMAVCVIAIIAIVETTLFRESHTSSTMAAWTILYFIFDFALVNLANAFLTNNLKYYVGRLRPDFFFRCELPANIGPDTALYGSAACTSSNAKELEGGQLSFPSGHTSFAFCEGIYLGIYLLWCFYIRPQSPQALRRLQSRSRFFLEVFESVKFLAIFLGPVVAWWIGATRIVDYQHHPSDVNGGALIGTACAVLVFVRGVGLYERVKPLVVAKSGDSAPAADQLVV